MPNAHAGSHPGGFRGAGQAPAGFGGAGNAQAGTPPAQASARNMARPHHFHSPRAGGADINVGDSNAVVTLHGTGNTVTAGDGNVRIAGASSDDSITLGAGQDVVALHGSGNTFQLNGTTASLLLSGPNNMVFVNGGTDVVKDSPNGTNLSLTVQEHGGSIALKDFSPTAGNVNLASSLFAQLPTPTDIAGMLVSDGHGGSALGFTGGNGASVYLDFVGVPLGSLTASNFHLI